MSSQSPQKADHERIEAVLKSKEWQQKLEDARARRAEILARRMALRSDNAAPLGLKRPAPPKGITPVAGPAVTPEAMRQRSTPAVSRASMSSRAGLVTGAILGFAVACLGWWLVGMPAPVPEPEITVAVPEQAAPVEPAEAPPALNFGASQGTALAIAPEFLAAALSAERPDAPAPTLAERLRHLGAVAPAGTRVHLPAGATQTLAAGLVPVPSRFATDKSVVRFFHAQDRDLAMRAAVAVGAEPADFGSYAPRPAPGTIEVWIAR